MQQHEQQYVGPDGKTKIHREKPSRPWTRCKITEKNVDLMMVGKPVPDSHGDRWENDIYYGTLRRYESGFPCGGGPYLCIGISAKDESAKHDWRDFQRIKNDLAGKEWEAVELYPAESRLVDPSNRFFLWCVPKGVFSFGFQERRVLGPGEAPAPQRAFSEP